MIAAMRKVWSGLPPPAYVFATSTNFGGSSLRYDTGVRFAAALCTLSTTSLS